jgi:hypothetical protein
LSPARISTSEQAARHNVTARRRRRRRRKKKGRSKKQTNKQTNKKASLATTYIEQGKTLNPRY